MTSDDRELLQILRRQQAELQQSLARIGDQLDTLEANARNGIEPDESLPPVPPALPPPAFEGTAIPSVPLDSMEERAELPPPPEDPFPTPPTSSGPPMAPTFPPIPRPSLEFQFGRWLTRIGAVFGIITLVLILSLTHHYLFNLVGPGGIIGLSGAVCMGVVVLAMRLERGGMLFFGRSLLALGLAGLYVTLYGAHSFDPVRVITNPLLAGVLLLLWSVYVFFLAERKRSQTLALFSVALAYFSTSINPIGRFTMAADLLLAGTAVIFLLRHGWAALSYLSLLGTYFALFRRLIVDENGQIVLDTSRALPFLPYAIYLIGTWVIFTTAVMLAVRPSFRGSKRFVFLSLNNGGLAALMTLTTYIAGYGFHAMGWTLLWIGVLFLATALSAGGRRPDSGFAEVTGAYFAQGLAAFTLGVMGVYTGITRGVILAFETFCLGVATTISRNEVVRVATAVTALLAAVFLAWEIEINARHPWLLGLSGAIIMFANAWWSRCSSLRPPRELMPSALYYVTLALGLIAISMSSEMSDSALAPALACVAVLLTFAVYLIPIYEVPPLAQTLMLAAQALVLFPRETGEAMPRTSTAWVAFLTMVLLTWWPRQRVIRFGAWVVALNFVYALALVGLAYHAIRPYLDQQSWMVIASLLSGGFLIFGAVTRVWSLAAMGQLFLGTAVYHFFRPHGDLTPFIWNGWAALIPLAVVFATGRALKGWLDEYPDIPDWTRLPLRLLASSYQILALAMVSRWIIGVIPAHGQIGAFLVLGTFILVWNTARARPFGIRCSFVLSLFGLGLLVLQLDKDPHVLVTFINGLSLFILLCQPTILRHAPRRLVTKGESWALILLSAGAGWIFVDTWVANRVHPNYFTMGWALYGVFLFFFGLLFGERRQRWCGLVILVAAIVRVFFVDIWGLSNGYKVFTFFVLTLIALGLGFIYARFANRMRNWL